jgi:lipopolysaccharide export LptBFGC system permease protein LptF
MNALRAIYKYWAAVLLVGVVVQVGAAGYGAFYASEKSNSGSITQHAFDHGFSFHDGFGYIIFVAAVVLLVLALAARLGQTRVLWALGAPLLVFIQIVLGRVGQDHPGVGVLHPINALLIFGVTGFLAHRAWRGPSTSS